MRRLPNLRLPPLGRDQEREGEQVSEMSTSWAELAQLTHKTQVEQFNWCACEEQEYFPFDDCPNSQEIVSTAYGLITRQELNKITKEVNF